MQKKGLLWVAPIALLALVAACGGNDKRPASPTTPSPSSAMAGSSAAADTVTLKVNAPALVSPVGGARLTTSQVTLTFQAATAKYVTGESFIYRVQLMNAGSTVIEEKVGAATSYTMSTQFDSDTLYRWRVRAEQQGQAGPWSTTETFKSMEKPAGYIRGNELYDPLDDGKTVGALVGNVTLIPGKGAQINDSSSWIEYTLPQTLTGGEYSALISNLSSDGPEVKTKVMAMKEGDSDITENEYRFTIEKRGNGVVAWRVIVGNDDQIDTVGGPPNGERKQLAFHESLEYFFKATWGGSFNLEIWEGGLNGSEIYSFGKTYDGVYQPTPHKVMAGCSYSPRSGPQSVAGMIIRQIWVSPNPRPSWAK
jgi:hypothetical protein